jgi:hypothetical protein
MEEVCRRYPVGRAEVEPRVFVRATDSWVELSARFRGAGPQRSRGMDTIRRVLDRFVEDPITVASTAQDIARHRPAPRE